MRIGVSSYAYRYAAAEISASQGLAAAAQHVLERSASAGADVVQFCDNIPLAELGSDDCARLGARAAQLGLSIDVGARGIDPTMLRAYLAIASEFGSRALRVVPGTSDATAIESALRAIGPDLARAAIPLAVENHADLRGPALANLVRRLGGPAAHYATCYDSANSLGLLELPLDTAAALGPLAVQAHIKDYCVVPAPIGYRIVGRRIGEGWLDLAGLARLLRDRLASLDLLVEQWMDPAEDSAATLREEEAWVRHNLAAVRSWAREAVRPTDVRPAV